jgi:uncharacterized membrane protein
MEKMKAKTRKLMVILILASFFLTLFSLAPTAAQTGSVEKRVGIRCDFPGQMIEAGDTAVFELILVNHGKTATYNLIYWTYGEAKRWDIKFMDNEKEVYKVLLPEGGSKTVTLDVATTGDENVDEYPIHVDIGDGHITLYVKVTKMHKGEKGKLELTVVDKEGEKVKGATVSVHKETGGALVDQMMTTAEGEVSIALPKGTYNVMIEKAGYKSEEKKDVKIRIERTTDLGIIPLEKELFFAEVAVKSPSKTVMIGTNPTYEIELKNVGKCDDTYRLTLQGLPDKWYSRYKESATVTDEISELFIKSGEAKTLYLEFVPPYDVEIGVHNFTSIVESSTGSYEKNLTLKLRGSYDMQVYSRRYRYVVNKGDTVSFDVIVSNTGNGGSLMNISMEVSAFEGWSADVSPKSVASLKPGDRRTFTIKVIPPADIVASEYKLSVKVKSEQVEKEDEFRIEVKEKSNIVIYGVAILFAVIVVLWYMFRKYGRR